jgi:hypothetical protein
LEEDHAINHHLVPLCGDRVLRPVTTFGAAPQIVRCRSFRDDAVHRAAVIGEVELAVRVLAEGGNQVDAPALGLEAAEISAIPLFP